MAYTHVNKQGTPYYLHRMMVTLRGGNREQTIHYFARKADKKRAIEAVPEGFKVVENKRTGLPVLKRK